MGVPGLIRDAVVNECQRLRPGETITTIEPTDFQGRAHDVYLVSLTNGSKLIARVARSEQDAEFERRALDIIQHIKKHNPRCHLPMTYWHNLDQPNRTHIIVLQDLLPGKPLSVWNSSIPTKSRHTFLDALAQFLFDLWSTDAPRSENASATVISYTEWLEDKIDNAISRCINGTGRWGKASDYLVMRSLIPHYTRGIGKITKAGIAHGDMNAYNFMVNEKLELTGVLDWDWTFEAPMPAVVQFPWFLADIPGWHNDGTIAGDDFEEDRRYLVQAFRSREKLTSADSTLSSLLDGARKRQRFQSAINYRDIHLEYVKSNNEFQEAKLEDLRPTLEAFLIKHPEFHEWVAGFQQDL